MNKEVDFANDQDVVIRLDNMSKAYGLPYAISFGRIANFFRHGLKAFRRDDMKMVLKDLSLDVRRGELLGVIGRNGAGKSTLLKVISGVSQPSAGKVSVHGRIFPMIELNAGMNPRFTGRENIYLLAAIMNIPRDVIESRMDAIEDFCDLGEFFDRPVREYSSGMPGRLGFAVAVYADADIVLIDEVLAVGDVNFRNRCTARMEELRDSGKTLVLVTHNMGAISALCTRAVVIEGGNVKFNGPSGAAIQFYGDLMQSLALRRMQKSYKELVQKETSPGCGVSNLQITNRHDEIISIINPRKITKFSFEIATSSAIEEGLIFLKIEDKNGTVLVSETTHVRLSGRRFKRNYVFEFLRGLPFRTGQYKLSIGLLDKFGTEILASLQKPIAVDATTKGSQGLIAPIFKFRSYITDSSSKRSAVNETVK